MDREPQELLPAMPPKVACALVDTSTGNQSPCGLSCSLRRSSTRPGSTVAVRAATSTSRTLQKYLELSMTKAAPVVCPHWLGFPPARGGGGGRRGGGGRSRG